MSRTKWVAAAVGFAVAVGAFTVTRLDDTPPATAPLRGGDVSTVILIPGFGGSVDHFTELDSRLEGSGVRVEYAPVERVDGSLSMYGERVAEQVGELQSEGETVGLVGFSAGGLIARSAVEQGATPERVVTVASPHRGTGTAELASRLAPQSCPQSCQDMVPGSEFLDGLPDVGEFWLSLYSEGDEVVRPWDSSVLPGAVNVNMSDCGVTVPHADLVRDSSVAGKVVGFLDGEPSDAVGC